MSEFHSFFFFFSSRRRHTRLTCDWSSDVCSSDLGWAKKPERVRVLELIRPAIEGLPEMKDAFSETMDTLSALDKQILVERHLISREHAAKSAGSGLVLNREETLCFMINEEDHL